jgi:tetratricopeptide (TPR) repeat protein
MHERPDAERDPTPERDRGERSEGDRTPSPDRGLQPDDRPQSDQDLGSAGDHDAGSGGDHDAGSAGDHDAGSGGDRESAYDLLQRGHELLERRHHAQAAIVLERADRIEPGKQSIVEALGRAYFNSGQHDRAREAFERLLELDPSSHYGHYALGQSLKRLARRDEAGTHLRLAVALSPETRLYRDALQRLGSGPARPPRDPGTARPTHDPDPEAD